MTHRFFKNYSKRNLRYHQQQAGLVHGAEQLEMQIRSRNRRSTWLLVAGLSFVVSICLLFWLTRSQTYAWETMAPLGGEQSDLLVNNRVGYQFRYARNRKMVRWLSFWVEPGDSEAFSKSLRQDPEIDKLDQQIESYRKELSCFRGSLIPGSLIAGLGEKVYRDTRYYSLTLPRRDSFYYFVNHTFNPRLATYAKSFGRVRVFVIPALDLSPKDGIPKDYFYLVMRAGEQGVPEVMTFCFPNDERRLATHLSPHLVSLRMMEERTGLNFFPDAPQSFQDRLELEPAERVWSPTKHTARR